MANSIEKGRAGSGSRNLLTGGPKQLSFEREERAAEDVISSFSKMPLTERQIFADNQPQLLPGKSKVKYFRYTGEIIIPRYVPISSTRRKQNKQEKHGQVGLNFKIVGKRPSESIPVGYETIEHAIGSRVHVLEEYQPTREEESQDTQIQRFEDVIEQTERLTKMFESGEITRDMLTEQNEQIYGLLETYGFLRTWVPNRKEAVDQLLKAIGPDSTDRINPTVSRMRLASTNIKWMIELYVGDMTIDKNQKLLLALIQERSLERFYIETVIQEAEDCLKSEPSREGRTELFEVIFELFRHNRIKTAPYRIPAFRLLFGTFGVPDIQSSGLRDLHENMFGPESEMPITNLRQIKVDYWSNNKNAQRRFISRLESGIQALKEALIKGEEKFKEYEDVIPSLVADGKR